MFYRLCFIVLSLCVGTNAYSQSLTISSNHEIEYRRLENGDRIPDYSYCGYQASNQPIPFVPARIKVSPSKGDATARIQRAIDYVGTLPPAADGFRGAVQLEKGEYRIEGSLHLTQSGVVLRGSGYDENGTVLTGAGVDRSTLIRIAGQDDSVLTDSIPIRSLYVPLNATTLPLNEGHNLKVGDKIRITRPSTSDWLKAIRADKIGIYVDYQLTFWEAGDFDLHWERTVVEVSSQSVTIDVPLTNSLDPAYGGGYIQRYQQDGRLNNVGVENLRCVSEYRADNAKDENHRWMAITAEQVENGWVRRVTGRHFVSSIVALWEGVRLFTVEDCKSLQPVGEIGGYRRYAFQTLGQQTLFQRCYSEYGYHDFSVGASVSGPNAFVQCYAYHPYSFSGTLGGWANGVLFDRVTVDGGALKIAFRDVDGQGGGWSGVNSLCWECRVPQLHLDAPFQAYNWAFGTWGQGYGNGSHEMPRQFLTPKSFYYAQWEARTGQQSEEAKDILSVPGPPLSETTPQYAALMSERSAFPELIMDQWIDTVVARHPFMLNYTVADITDIPEKKIRRVAPPVALPIEITAGRIGQNGVPLVGRTQRTALWRGNLRPNTVKNASVHLTRFVPGREGRGMTDNLDSVAATLRRRGAVALNHFPALWYERRRDDHGRSRRADADVWAPFYEQPFSRSGVGEAFDRLSKYDLDRFNPWYWSRLRQFAQIADRNGLLFVQEHYLQHNIIEEGAHWADYPWRAANNINGLSFPENTYYAGDKRVFMADQFYDITNERLADYHRRNIRKHLDELGDCTNTVHHLGLEYTGPLHFAQFWLDVIRQWEQETHKDVRVMLSATKDITDGILADAAYASMVDIIDIRQWHYRTDGSLYAPQGGVSLAQRQYARLEEVGDDGLDAVYRAVSEYRHAYPDKAVVYNFKHGNSGDWAAYVGGASLCAIPKVEHPRFYKETSLMKPLAAVTSRGKHWGMGKPSAGYLLYALPGTITLDLTNDNGSYVLRWIDPLTGKQEGTTQKVSAGKMVELNTPSFENRVLWLSRK